MSCVAGGIHEGIEGHSIHVVTLDEVLAAVQAKGVCPMPSEWIRVYKMLPHAQASDGGRVPPSPLILGAWGEPALVKAERFEEHLRWADEHGVLDKVFNYLKDLPPDRWFASSE